MNILHMRYALEVARLGSLNKAAESLIIAQPNISRSIKELEADLGIQLFHRSAKGMVLTPEGEEFIGYAKGILEQIDAVEALYRGGNRQAQKLVVSAPGSPYISSALARLAGVLGKESAEISLLDGDALQTIHRVANRECTIGIIRYVVSQDRDYKALLAEKRLTFELLTEFSMAPVMNKNHPLAKRDVVRFGDLAGYPEIVSGENDLLRKGGENLPSTKMIISDRATQFEYLSEYTEAFAWMLPIAERQLARYGLVQRTIPDRMTAYKDLLIYAEDYRFSKIEERFVTALCEAKRRCL